MNPDFYRRSTELFLAAANLTTEDQHELLTRECGEDAALRCEVEKLLQQDLQLGPIRDRESVHNFASAQSLLDAANAPQESLDPSPPANHFPVIAGFTILSQLGEGATSVIFRAFQQSTNREVALKTLFFRQFASKKSRQRFEREIELAASLEHANIAHIYDSGESAGVLWLAMELIDGLPLDQYLKIRPQDQRAKLTLMIRVCDAVSYAHRQGIIHRDLKPGNILVREQGQPVVVDFGLARLAGQDQLASQGLSLSGEILGTPGFMSPEQARGENEATDLRSDCYSLGSLLFWLITGATPYDLTGSIAAVTRRIGYEQPRRPAELGVSLDRDFTALLAKSISTDPEDRYQTAEELSHEIQRYLNHEPLMVRSRSSLYLIGKWLARHRIVTTTVVSMIFAALTGVLIFIVSLRSEQQRTERANRELQITSDELRLTMASHSLTLAQELCEFNDLTQGIQYLREAFSYVPDGHDDLRHVIRANQRAWEHDVWLPIITLREKGPIRRIDLSSDGKSLLAMSNTFAQAWNLESGSPKGSPLTHAASPDGKPARVWSAQFSPDGQFILTAGSDGRAMIWSSVTSEATGIEFAHFDPASIAAGDADVRSAEFSPDGKRILTAGGRTLRLWDAQTGQAIGNPLTQDSPVRCGKFHPGGEWLAAGGADGMIRFWDCRTESMLGEPLAGISKALINNLKFNQEGSYFLVVCADGRIQIWETATRKQLRETSPVNRLVIDADFNNQDRGVYALSDKGEVQRWEITYWNNFHRSLILPGEASCLTVDSPTQQVAVGDAEGTIRLQKIPAHGEVRQRILASSPISSVAVDLKSSTLWIVMKESRLEQWDLQQDPPVLRFQQELAFPAESLSISPDGNRLAVVGGAIVRQLDTRTRQFIGSPWESSMGNTSGPVLATTYCPEGKQLAIGTQGGDVDVWDGVSQKSVSRWKCGGAVTSLFFSPDSQYFIAASTDRNVWIWPIGAEAEGRGPVQLEHPEAVLSMALSPDGRTLLTGCRDGTTRLWSLFHERKLLSEIKQVHPVTAVAFYPQQSPESNWILTGFRDGSVKTWDTKTGFPIGPTFRHNTTIQSLHLLDRGRVVMSTSSDRNIRFWRLPTSPESSP